MATLRLGDPVPGFTADTTDGPIDGLDGQRLTASSGLSLAETTAKFVNVESVKPYLRFVDAPPHENAA